MLSTAEKLQILSADSQYDLACACGTGKDDGRHRTEDGKWLYPVPLAAGGTGILFKTLLSNACTNDCRYCPLRGAGNARRCSLAPEELANYFLETARRRPLLGMFLSSAVPGRPEQAMEKILDTAAILRRRHHYKGYLHLKVIPGASEAAMLEALRLANAVSLNIEVPGKRHFTQLSQAKDYDHDIIAGLRFLSEHTQRGSEFSRVKCTTQFLVGASNENDREILRYMDGLYHRLHFQRIYFSAYQKGLGERSIPGEQDFSLDGNALLNREHRLYQVDFLLRQYRFAPDEIEFGEHDRLSLEFDPKELWAQRHGEFFPVRVNTADKETLLRVPGLGPLSVEKILKYRKLRRLPHLGAAGLTGKLARKANLYLDFS